MLARSTRTCSVSWSLRRNRSLLIYWNNNQFWYTQVYFFWGAMSTRQSHVCRPPSSATSVRIRPVLLPYHHRYPYSPIVERPDYCWPDGKRLAFFVGLNIEHFAFGTGLTHSLSAHL